MSAVTHPEPTAYIPPPPSSTPRRDSRHPMPEPPMTRFEKEDLRDAIRTRKWLAGGDMSREQQWIVKEKNIPCAWYAISVLAKEHGIKSVKRHAKQSKYDGKWYATATVTKGHAEYASTRTAAGFYHEEVIALAFACRNAIKFLLPQAPEGERLAYQDTHDNAVRKYA